MDTQHAPAINAAIKDPLNTRDIDKPLPIGVRATHSSRVLRRQNAMTNVTEESRLSTHVTPEQELLSEQWVFSKNNVASH